MKILKSDGTLQEFNPNKILNRIKKASKGLKVDYEDIFKSVISEIKEGMSTKDIDESIAYGAADKIIEHPDYSKLGGRVLVSSWAKYLEQDLKPVDENYNFFSAYTFFEKYAKRDGNGNPTEIPSVMYQRVTNHLHSEDADRAELLEELYSKKLNFASPIYTNSGVEGRNALISCNLTVLKNDSLDGIEETKLMIAKASKEGSGLGLLIDPLRSRHTLVKSFKYKAGGVIRFADMIQSTMRFYKQGNRSGSCALYMSLWHRDILDFLELRLPIGEEQNRARDLFYGVVVNDLFMEKLIANEPWYLFCPEILRQNGIKPFQDIWGEEFETEYQKAVDLGIGYEIQPSKIIEALIKAQVESGNPYVFFKDNANKHNMQDNIGTITMLNLCSEVCSVSKPGYTSQCTLGSINLAEQESLESIGNTVRVLVKALNKVIDKNKWSDEWSEKAGIDQRSIAIGVAGLADFFAKRQISFESQEAKDWQQAISEVMYKEAVKESNRLAEESGESYPSWEGSKYQKGITYIDGWSPKPQGESIPMKNSLLIGLMPTASSAILLGAFESFEPVTSNFFTRRVGQGEYLVVNEHLVKDLEKIGLWNEDMRDRIISNRGSVQTIMEIPQKLRDVYKDVWEIPQKTLLDLSAIRNKYVDHSQSLNVYHSGAEFNKILSALVYAWKIGLKTGVYYTRTKSKLQGSTDMAVSKVETKKSNYFECDGCSA